MYIVVLILYTIFPVLGFFLHTSRITSHQRFKSINFHNIRKSTSKEPGLQLIKWGVLAALAAFLSLIPLMGLPGAMIIQLLKTVQLLPESVFEGDAMWPTAIILSLVMPLAWPFYLTLRNAAFFVFKKKIEFNLLLYILIWFFIIWLLIHFYI